MIKRLRLKFIVINMGIATILLSAILGLGIHTALHSQDSACACIHQIPYNCSGPDVKGGQVSLDRLFPQVQKGVMRHCRIPGVRLLEHFIQAGGYFQIRP